MFVSIESNIPNWHTLVLELEEDSTIKDLKSLIGDELHVPVSFIILTEGGRVLEDSETVEWETIYLGYRLV